MTEPTRPLEASIAVTSPSPAEALKQLEALLNRDPGNMAAWLAAADILGQCGEFAQAAAAFRRVLALDPTHPAARYRLIQALLPLDALAEAEWLIKQLIDEQPQSPAAWTLLAALRQKQVRDKEAAQALRRSLALHSDPAACSNLLQIMQYDEAVTPAALLAAHREWNRAYAAAVAPRSPPGWPHKPAADKLRIGLVSADFGRHPIGFLALRPLECLDKTQCSVVCYYDRLPADEYTARFRAAADAWHITAGWSDEQLAAQIRADQIDVLIDLMGHTGHRLLVFARRPAPVQTTWLGYVGTTGVAAIDFLLADRHHVRPDEEHYYTERVLRLPHGYACYGPPADAPVVSPLPAQSALRVTFGSFNNAAKLSPRILAAWSEILRRLPHAQLLLKNRSFAQPELRDRLHAHFAQHYIPPQRILLEGGAPQREFWAAYSRLDIALDTQPYSGGLTTCEALWMGVPVITYPGATFAGRHSTSHLASAGLEAFIAPDLAGYIELAVAWAGRLDELALLRSTLRERLTHSPLCDAPQFAADFLAVLQHAFKERSNA